MQPFNKSDIHFITWISLCTEHEKQLYEVLSKNLDQYYHDQYIICPKVRIVDIVHMDKKDFNQTMWNRVKSRHVDFLLCTKIDLKPILAIELQDSTHKTKKGLYRDILVKSVFESAWLRLLPLWTTDFKKVTGLLWDTLHV
jgi:hypothetical protein